MATSRLPGLDALKAAGIACVVLIHAAPPQPAWYERHVVEGVARLGVPVFLLVTGFLAGRLSWSRSRLRRGGLRFLRLHLIWASFYWALELARKGPPDPWRWKSALLHYGEGAYAGQFYFAILIQVFLFAGWLLPEGASRRPAVVSVSALAALGGIALLPAGPALCAAVALPGWVCRPIALGSAGWLWFYYFSLGAWLGALPSDARLARLGSAATAALLSAGVAVASAGVLAIPGFDAPPPTPYTRLAIYAGATLVALALPAVSARPAPAALRRVGTETFGIFVLNPALLGLWSALLGPVASLPGSALRFAATFAVALPISSLLRRRAGWALP